MNAKLALAMALLLPLAGCLHDSQLGPFDCVYSANVLVQRLFGAAGYPVTAPELQNRRAWEGAAIRRALAGGGDWEAALQPEVAALVQRYGGPERLRALAREADLDPEFSEKFLRFIIDEVIRHHERAAGR